MSVLLKYLGESVSVELGVGRSPCACHGEYRLIIYCGRYSFGGLIFDITSLHLIYSGLQTRIQARISFYYNWDLLLRQVNDEVPLDIVCAMQLDYSFKMEKI